MNFKKITASVLAMAFCLSATSCSVNQKGANAPDASSVAKTSLTAQTTTTTAPASTTAATTSVAASIDENSVEKTSNHKFFEKLKKKYENDYYIKLKALFSGATTTQVHCVKNKKAYLSQLNDGRQVIAVLPDSKTFYNINVSTTTYTKTDVSSKKDYYKQIDILFGATAKYSKSYLNKSSKIVLEYYNLDKSITTKAGYVIYGFKQDTGELAEVVIQIGSDNPTYYTVEKISKADESLLKVPDLSSYSES